ncbi:phytanoyl-CoA dioxygenase [Polyplosphaeria fusca]|uniref:Phytanoyl-CoA dioxygenase n=1 Tax=Polyplosphaeria fusca TaxID=682080 RepID=A0A9P4UW17_9PLEO|nr:phytanoyl-CoA dioxygenase [Polyplosphaeria fusca]
MAITTPQPLPPSYKPTTSLTALPATIPTPDILSILARDGALILTDLVSPSDLSAIDTELSPYHQRPDTSTSTALSLIPPETLVIPGLVGKSATIARLCESPVLEALRTHILRDEFSVLREDVVEQHVIDPLLSISITLHIGPGAPRQRLHRDDNVHGIRHGGKFELRRASQVGVLVAGSRTMRENGATMVVPGSHLWGDERVPKVEEVCFAEMAPGSALIFLASCYHGGGHNSTLDSTRKMHGLFFVRGTLRTEENQFLAIPTEKVKGMSEGMWRLLGWRKPSSVLGIVDNGDAATKLLGA